MANHTWIVSLDIVSSQQQAMREILDLPQDCIHGQTVLQCYTTKQEAERIRDKARLLGIPCTINRVP